MKGNPMDESLAARVERDRRDLAQAKPQVLREVAAAAKEYARQSPEEIDALLRTMPEKLAELRQMMERIAGMRAQVGDELFAEYMNILRESLPNDEELAAAIGADGARLFSQLMREQLGQAMPGRGAVFQNGRSGFARGRRHVIAANLAYKQAVVLRPLCRLRFG